MYTDGSENDDGTEPRHLLRSADHRREPADLESRKIQKKQHVSPRSL